MTQSEANDFVMPLGKYKGLTLDEIAGEEDDLDYLIWLRNARDDDENADRTDLDEALAAFLEDA